MLCDRAGHVSRFPSSSGLEAPLHQADFFLPSLSASRLPGARPTSSLLTGLEGPRHPPNQVVMTPSQNREAQQHTEHRL